MKKLVTTVFTVSLLALASIAQAQEVTQMPKGKHHAVSLETGLDSAFLAKAGYTYRIKPRTWAHDILFQAKLAIPIAVPDLTDHSLDGGVRSTAFAYGNLRLQWLAGPVIRNTHTTLFDANSVGVQAVLFPGYQSERWGLMAELGYEKMLSTNIRHSHTYRSTFYAGARDGWYADTAGTFRIGLRGGVRIGSVELNARVGVMATERGNAHVPPFFATLGASYAL